MRMIWLLFVCHSVWTREREKKRNFRLLQQLYLILNNLFPLYDDEDDYWF